MFLGATEIVCVSLSLDELLAMAISSQSHPWHHQDGLVVMPMAMACSCSVVSQWEGTKTPTPTLVDVLTLILN